MAVFFAIIKLIKSYLNNGYKAMRTWIEIIKSHIHHNCATVKKYGSSFVNFVVKANAYGHGIDPIAKFLCDENLCQGLCVAHSEEVAAVRMGGWKGPLLVLSYSDFSGFQCIKDAGAQYTIHSVESAQEVIKWCNASQQKMDIHIKIDTGMHRLGLQSKEEIELVCRIIKESPWIEVKGVLSHCHDPAAYDACNSIMQAERFDYLSSFVYAFFPDIQGHMYASGTYTLDKKYDAIRCGSALYGLWKSADQKKRVLESFPDASYKQILRWKSRIMSIKSVKKDEYVGYGCFYKATENMKIAVIPVGYWDGYSRLLSGKASVIINGKAAPLCGYVSMNMLTVDISNIDASYNDEVLLSDPDYESISLQSLAAHIKIPAITFSTGIAAHIPRILVEN